MGILCRYLIYYPYHLSSMARSLLFLRRIAGSTPVGYTCHHLSSLIITCKSRFFFLSRKTHNFWKNYVQKNSMFRLWVSTKIRTQVLRFKVPGAMSTWLFGTATALYVCMIKQWFNYEFWWVFYPDNYFLVDLYHEMLGPGVNVGSYPFPFGIKISLVSMRKPIFLVARDQASIPGVFIKKMQNIYV